MIVKDSETIALDSKGRIYLSKEERAGLDAEIVVAKSRKRFLFLTKEELDSIITEELTGLKGLELRRKRRALFASVFLQKIDRQGRVLIPPQQRR